MNLKQLIKDTERDLFDIKHSKNPNSVNLAKIRISVRKQTVEAVDKTIAFDESMFPEKFKDWQTLKRLLGMK